MFTLRIEHPVPSFEGWKKAFDGDPVGREKSGVRRYRISRTVDDANFVTVDLEFDSASQAEALLTALRVVWGRVEGKVVTSPAARILEVVERREYGDNSLASNSPRAKGGTRMSPTGATRHR